MKNDDKVLKVAEARSKDAGRGIARIDSAVMDILGITAGDVIQIEGKKRTAAIAWPGLPEDTNKGIVRIDGTLRRNADTGIDDRISIRKISAKEATKITVAPTKALRIVGGEEYLRQILNGRVIVKGDIVEVNTLEGRIDLVVTNCSPVADALIVKSSTEFTISEKPASETPSVPRISYEDIGGLGDEVKKVREMIELPLRHPELFERLGIEAPKGVLLHGPPGTGKTLLAKAVASETNANFMTIGGPEIMSKYHGESEEHLREIFKQAQENAPTIIFIDEIDAIGKSRDSQFGGNDEREQTLNQLLSEMDGFDSSKGVLILAATNRPEVLDKALLRPGRFDRRIIVDKPDLKGRLDTLKVHSKDVLMDESVDLEAIALATAGAVGSDLANIINEAAINAVKHHRRAVNQEDLFESVEVVIAGKEKKDRILGKEEKKMVAYHEVGHALVTALTKDAEPVQKITIVPRTMGSLGYTMQVPEEEKYLYKKEELEAKILTLLGGRAAEEIIFGTMTTGASNDIERATKLAGTMISQYGMSDRLGIAGFEAIENKYLDGKTTLNCSDKTAAVIDEEVIKMLKESYIKTKGMLQNNLECLHKVSEYLLEKESITGKEFMEIVNSVKNKNEESDNND